MSKKLEVTKKTSLNFLIVIQWENARTSLCSIQVWHFLPLSPLEVPFVSLPVFEKIAIINKWMISVSYTVLLKTMEVWMMDPSS
jgi:hypothetical protein